MEYNPDKYHEKIKCPFCLDDIINDVVGDCLFCKGEKILYYKNTKEKFPGLLYYFIKNSN